MRARVGLDAQVFVLIVSLIPPLPTRGGEGGERESGHINVYSMLCACL